VPLCTRKALAEALNVPAGPLYWAVWGSTREERRMYRRHLLQMVWALPAFALQDLPTLSGFGLHEDAVQLVKRYPTAAPAEVLADARSHLIVRDRMLPGWADTQWVRELDERLRWGV
jgi:hypothetical protein